MQIGHIITGDIVSYRVDGRLYIGELALNVGFVYPSGNGEMRSVASSWEVRKDNSDGGIDMIVKDNVIKFFSKDLLQSFAYRMSDDRTSCFVLVPYEFLAMA